MADEEKKVEEKGDENITEKPATKKGLSIKLIIIIVVTILLIVGAGVGAYLFFSSDPKEGVAEDVADKKELTPQNIAYMDFPELLINLKGKNKKQKFMKAVVVLELEKPEDQPIIAPLVPRIMDSFQVYLRELRLEDIEGSGGMDRLRDELLTRLNTVVSPVKVYNVLFKQFLIQ